MITKSLKVSLWGQEIGRLSWDGRRGLSYFEYSRDFLRGNIDAFPLIAPINAPSSHRPIMGDGESKIYRKLPPFLADSLPDAWGSQVFECWRVENGIRNLDITPLDILAFIGKRGMGALEFEPETSGINSSENLNLQALAELAGRIFTEREKVAIKPEETLTMKSLIAVGTSAGGRQPKAIIAVNPATGEVRSGQIAGLKGFEYSILKFGDPERSSAELEMAYYEMATAAGIEMMPCRLIEVDGKRHFITRRFDREAEHKLHTQTLAALYPEADSYEKLLMVCRKMRLPESAQEEIFRRMVFNILANNTDDHNKNFSFLMDREGKWSLAPAYDLTYIFNIGGHLPETTHCLTMRGKLFGQTKEDALAVAKENGIRKAESIIQQVADAVSKFRSFAERNGVKKQWTSAVESTINRHLEDWGLTLGKTSSASFTLNGRYYSNVRIEPTYKGNYHLLADIDGKERKFVIGRNKPEHATIQSIGTANLTEEQLKEMCGKYFS